MKVLMVLIFSMIVVEIHGLKHFLVEEYLPEMKTHIIHIIKELKSTRFSWKMKLRVGAAFEYDNDDKRIEGAIFTHCNNEKPVIMMHSFMISSNLLRRNIMVWILYYSQRYRILIQEIRTHSPWLSLLLITEYLHAILRAVKKLTRCHMLLES